MNTPIPPNRPAIIGPHCGHDGCSMHVCDDTGYAEFPCRNKGCPVCGAPSMFDPEHWAADLARYQDMTPEQQERVQAYWILHPLMRQAWDVLPTIPAERAAAGRAALNGGR